MGTRVEWREFPFDDWQKFADFGPFGLPGEMDGDGILLVGGTHPEVVGSDGANFGDHQVRTDLFVQLLDGEDGVERVFAGNEIFGLQFFAGAGRETHFEMRETVVPRTGSTHLLGAIFGGECGDGVKISGGARGTEKIFPLLDRRLGWIDSMLEPDFVDALILPVGEETHAVGSGKNLVEVVFERVEGKILEDVLRSLKRRLDVERHFADDAKCAEADHSAGKNVGIGFARKCNDIAGGVDDFESDANGGRIPVFYAGAVGAGGDSASDGNVRQGGEIVQRETALFQHWCNRAVANARTERDGASRGIDRRGLYGEIRGEQLLGAVGNAIEAVAGAECFETGMLADEILHARDGVC